MKKIIYLSFNNPVRSYGVYKKEVELCNVIKQHCIKKNINFKGVNISVFDKIKSNKIKDYEYFHVINVNNISYRFFKKSRILRGIYINSFIYHKAYQIVKEEKPDIVFMRSTYPLVFNPKKVDENIVVITEHQSKEYEEMLNLVPKQFHPILKFLDRKYYTYLKTINGIVGVTSEITYYELSKINKKIPNFTFTNGINVNKFPLKKRLNFDGNKLNMIFIASLTNRWHGVDRILKGLAKYNGDYDITLNIIGNATRDIQNLIYELNLYKKVNLLGPKYGKELDKIFDQSHIAIGTLGLHRIGLQKASTLKVREYMARGIPFIISYDDEDISDDFPFVMRVPPNDSSLNMDDIIKFTEQVYKIKDFSIRMREYALKYMDYDKKVEKLLDFILKI